MQKISGFKFQDHQDVKSQAVYDW